MDAGARIVNRELLRLSKAPADELAAAAIQAAEDAGLELGAADFIVVAVPGSQADDPVVEATLAAIAVLPPA